MSDLQSIRSRSASKEVSMKGSLLFISRIGIQRYVIGGLA
jgi:hypothetical protein